MSARRLHRFAVLVAALGATMTWPAALLAATPEATRAVGNDPRSSGEGPGLVGEPLLAIGLVVAIGLAALLLTLVYVRATGGRAPRS